jgi:hypothetical protein
LTLAFRFLRLTYFLRGFSSGFSALSLFGETYTSAHFVFGFDFREVWLALEPLPLTLKTD